MKINSSLAKKLKAYSALAGVVAVAPMAVNAQIIYTNVEPDTVVNFPDGVYNLDLNNDGIIDFEFHLEKYISSNRSGNTSTWRYLEIAPHQQNEMACSYISSYYGSPAEFVKGDIYHHYLFLFKIKSSGNNPC